jgi:hypothetical protein
MSCYDRWAIGDCGCSCTITICVVSSGTSVGAGATVAVTGVGSFTTNSSGCISFSGAAGSYALTITSTGNPTYTSTAALVCGTNTIDVGLLTCNPCGLPRQNLTLSWTNLLTGPGSTTLTYDPTTVKWTAICVDDQSYELLCSGDEIVFIVTFYLTDEGCPGGESNTCSNIRANPFGLTLASSTCSPFSVTFNTSPNCPDVEAPGYLTFTITYP